MSVSTETFSTIIKWLNVVIFIFLLKSAIFGSEFVKCETTILTNPQQLVCENNACIEIANDVLEKMNRTVNPCDDFYEFACGNFSKSATVPDGEHTVNIYTTVEKKIYQQLKNSLENTIEDTDPQAIKTLKSIYNTCMNADLKNNKTEEDMKEILNKIGKWPLLHEKSWVESDFDWQRDIKKFRENGYPYPYFIKFKVELDMKNSSRRIIQLDQPSLGLSRNSLIQGLEHKDVKAYFKYMIGLARIFGMDQSQAEIQLKASVDFEIELAKISIPYSQRRNKSASYHIMTIDELKSQYSFVSWEDFLNGMMSPSFVKVTPDEVVNIKVPNFLKELEKLIVKTPNRVLANYAYWRVLADSVPYLSEQVRNAKKEFDSAIAEGSQTKLRWQECVEMVNKMLPLATGSMYVRKYFNQKSKDNVSDIVYNTRNSFRRMISEAHWMEDDKKNKAYDRLENMLLLIGYPDELLNDKMLDDYHEGLRIYPNSLIRTVLNGSYFALKHDVEKLRKPVMKIDWTDDWSPVSVEGIYEPITNSLALPAGLYHELFFNAERPKYMNYGSNSFLIGVYIFGSFDQYLKAYKGKDLVRWWDAETQKKYPEKAKCIDDQYRKYSMEELDSKINGVKLPDRNIRDNAALKVAYFAYKDWQVKQNHEEPRISNLESYTPDQMFWISYANTWCTKYSPEYLQYLEKSKKFTLAKHRLIGTVSNMPEFARDFRCSSESNMNPSKRCSVW